MNDLLIKTDPKSAPGEEYIKFADAGAEQQALPTATGTGTSTGTTALAVTSVTGAIQIGATVTGTGVPANTRIISQNSGPKGGAGGYTTSGNTTLAAVALTFTPAVTTAMFPAFTPILPPPLVGQGGGAAPTFPPPTPPPIGHVPVGPLVGPAVAPASVPPSVAGEPRIKTASTHPATFPDFTTTSPSPPVQITGTPPPTMITTTPSVPVGGWGPPGPVVPTAPHNTVAPVISGSTAQAGVVNCTTGTWTGSPTPTYTYQWLADGINITGATSSSWTVSGHSGELLECQVTATNSAGSASAMSNELGPIGALEGAAAANPGHNPGTHNPGHHNKKPRTKHP